MTSDQLFDALVDRARVAIQDAQADNLGSGQARLSEQALEALVVDEVSRGLTEEAKRRSSLGLALLTTNEERSLLVRVVRFVTGLGPIEDLLADEDVEEIYGHYDYVQVDKHGQPSAVVHDLWPSEQAMLDWLADMARNRGLTERQFNAGAPLLVLRLRAGMRLSAVRSVSQRAVFNLRRNTINHVTIDDLVRRSMLPPHVGELLRASMRCELMRIVFVGATGAGKTTLARACLDELGPEKNVVIIEDTAEIDMWHRQRHPLFHSFEVREANAEGEGEVPMSVMVRQTLRHRPDWFSVGECRDGDTAAEMLKAMTSGHSSLTTVHAESARGGVAKLALMLAMSSAQLSLQVANNLIAEGVDLIIHTAKDGAGHRSITEVIEVAGFDGQQATINQIYRSAGSQFGYQKTSPFSEALATRLANAGLELDALYRANAGVAGLAQ
ncbi:MAG: ATPase, T2SS/T4P/T4SS family [Actinomycetota bacterium]